MEVQWLALMRQKLNEALKAIKQKGVKVQMIQGEDSLTVIVDLVSLTKKMREEAKQMLIQKMRASPFTLHFRKINGVEVVTSKATGVMTPEDEKRLRELETQYPNILTWKYDEKKHQLTVVIVLTEFYKRGLEEIINRVKQELAQGIAMMSMAGVELEYEIKVEDNLIIRVYKV